jgi:hypothetical protein
VSPDVVTVEELRLALAETTAFLHFVGGTLLAAGVWIWFEGWLKRNGCPQCAHCKREREQRQARDKRINEKFLGIDPESQAARERLFGKRVVEEPPPEEVASDEEAPGRPDGDPR